MQKKCTKILPIQKKAVLLHPLLRKGTLKSSNFRIFKSSNGRVSPLSGAPENFNFWGEREHDENSYERRSRESY